MNQKIEENKIEDKKIDEIINIMEIFLNELNINEFGGGRDRNNLFLSFNLNELNLNKVYNLAKLLFEKYFDGIYLQNDLVIIRLKIK